jgi:hypothetical protein
LFKKVSYDKKRKVKPEKPKELKLFYGLLEDRPQDKSDHLAIVIPHKGYFLSQWDYMQQSFELLYLLKTHFGEGVVSYQEIQKRFPQITRRRLKLRLSWLWANGFLVKWAQGIFLDKDSKARYKSVSGIYYGIHYQVAKARITNWREWSSSLKE